MKEKFAYQVIDEVGGVASTKPTLREAGVYARAYGYNHIRKISITKIPKQFLKEMRDRDKMMAKLSKPPAIMGNKNLIKNQLAINHREALITERMEAEERARQAAAPRIILFVEGGVVHDVYTDKPVQIRVIDYDIESGSDSKIKTIRLPGGGKHRVVIQKYNTKGLEGKDGLDYFYKQRAVK